MGRLWSDLGPIKITVQSWGATRAHLLYVHFPHRHLSFKGCGCGGRYIENPAYGKKRKVVSLPYFSRSTVCLMVVLCKSGESLEKSWSGLGQNITLRSLASSWESLKNNFLLLKVLSVARAFIELGLEPFHTVAILGHNDPCWHIRSEDEKTTKLTIMINNHVMSSTHLWDQCLCWQWKGSTEWKISIQQPGGCPRGGICNRDLSDKQVWQGSDCKWEFCMHWLSSYISPPARQRVSILLRTVAPTSSSLAIWSSWPRYSGQEWAL